MAYERIKVLAFKQKQRSFEKAGKPWTTEDDKLVGFRAPACDASATDLFSLSPSKPNITYIMASGASKIFALAISYPYQVVRARIQVRIPYRPSQTPEPDDIPHYHHHHPPRTTPRRTYIPTSPLASPKHTPNQESGGSTVASGPTSSGFCREPALLSWCTRISRGYSGGPQREEKVSIRQKMIEFVQ